MPAEFRTPAPSPAKVHDRARSLLGFHPCWLTRKYVGGLYDIGHFRVCAYCGCINPLDMIDLLYAGRSILEETAKPGKLVFVTPNPIAGELVRMGTISGKVFPGTTTHFPPARRLAAPTREDLEFVPTPGERLAGHYERPVMEIAPDWIRWPFYSEHSSDRQWPEIAEAASIGGHYAALPSS